MVENIWTPYIDAEDDWGDGFGDWDEAFHYASAPRLTVVGEVVPNDSWDRWQQGEENPHPTPGFTRQDVTQIIAASSGNNDGPDWIMLGRLNDLRYFFLYAGCDYTGWDCRAGGGTYVGDSPEELVRWAMSDEDRKRLALPLPT